MQPSVAAVFVWKREDNEAICYRSTLEHGPKWETVVLRRTLDAHSGDVIEELHNPTEAGRHRIHGRIPGAPRDIVTELHYEAEQPLPQDDSEPPAGVVDQEELPADDAVPPQRGSDNPGEDVEGPFPMEAQEEVWTGDAAVETQTIYTLRCLLGKKTSLVLEQLQHIVLCLANQGCIVVRIHSDRGTEFVKKIMSAWACSKGVRMTRTAGGDPKSNGRAERGVGRAKEGGRRNLVASGLAIARWPWAIRHWSACEWARAFDLPAPLPYGQPALVRQKDWQLLNAFDPRMLPGIYLGPEDVDSVSAGHLVLVKENGVESILRATTIHKQSEPLQGKTRPPSGAGHVTKIQLVAFSGNTPAVRCAGQTHL